MSNDTSTTPAAAPQQKDDNNGPKRTMAQMLEDMPWRNPTEFSASNRVRVSYSGYCA